MPAVLVHGVPDTTAMWDRLRARLARDDVVTLALPGFGTPVSDGWSATKEEYAGWIVEQLDALGEPVDLVGHDWGSILVQRVASIRPDLIRTLACGGGPVDRAYEWHATAKAWQTFVLGEQIVAGMVALPRDVLATSMAAAGAPADLAARQAERIDRTMADCILGLYRSAVTVGDDWEDAVAAMPARPATVLWGRDDPYVTPEFAERLARRIDAELVVFDDCGHWWPWERADESAVVLERLWSRAP